MAFPFNLETTVIVNTTPRSNEPAARVEAYIGADGRPGMIVAWLPIDSKTGGFPRYDFFAGPDAWREIILALAPFLGMKVVDPERSGGHVVTGRGAAAIPDDVAPFLAAIGTAQTTGTSFHKTGRNGLYTRRLELPAAFRIGRDRLECLAADLLKAGMIAQDEAGALTVPESSS